MPVAFVSHGAPTLALDAQKGQELFLWAESMPKPRGVLVISAHWQAATLTRGTTVSRPPLVYDVDGFSDELRAVTYPAPGAPDLAYDLHALVGVERDPERGWDHGVWAPLVHMLPAADVPVLQLSLARGMSPRRLFGFGRRIGALASRYLILGSGGVTHNPAEIDLSNPVAEVPPWATAFDAWLANALADQEMDEVLSYRSRAPHALLAHPTSEHIDPLFVIAGAASVGEHAIGFPVRGFEHGSLSRRCIQFGR